MTKNHIGKGSDEDIEAGVHSRVKGIGSKASEVRADGRSGSEGTGADRINATQLGESVGCWDAGRRGQQGGDT